MHTSLLVAAIWCCLLLFGLFQERIATSPYGETNDSTTAERFTGTPLLYLVGTIASAAVATVAAAMTGQKVPPSASAPRSHLQFCLVALCACVGSPIAYISLRYIDYPLLVLASSCKLLPIIVVGSVAHNANYGALDFATAGAMGVGVALYSSAAAAPASAHAAAAAHSGGQTQLPPAQISDDAVARAAAAAIDRTRVSGCAPGSDSGCPDGEWWSASAAGGDGDVIQLQPGSIEGGSAMHHLVAATTLPPPPPPPPPLVSPAVSTGIGLSLVALNLLIDGVMTTGQDALYARYDVPPFIMMARINGWGAALVATALAGEAVVSGWPASIAGGAAAFVGRHPSLGVHLVGLAACSALAQLFVYVALRRHGSFVTTAITISRKFVSVLLSVVLFGHELTSGQWVGVAAVFAGLSLQLVAGAAKKRRQQQQQQLQQQQDKPAELAGPPGGAGVMPDAPVPVPGDRTPPTGTGEVPAVAPLPARLQPPRTPPLRVAFGTVSTPHLTSYGRLPSGSLPVPQLHMPMDEASPPNSGGGAVSRRRRQFRLDSS